MTGRQTRHQGRVALYRGTAPARLWRRAAAVCTLALALGAGGCSLSSQFDSLFGSNGDQTGSITPPPGAKGGDQLPPATDLAYARAAVKELLARGTKDSSLPWENPATGARGTVTPISQAYADGDQTCHDFLASYVNGGSEAWLQGAACKPRKGGWEVRSMKPWKQS